jgi:DNA-binding GntR family transcriptional regulator
VRSPIMQLILRHRRQRCRSKEHLEIPDACLARNTDLAVARLSERVQISREHTLGIRPMPL